MRNTIVLTRKDLVNPEQTLNYDVYTSFKTLSVDDVNKAYAIYFDDEGKLTVFKQKNQGQGIDPTIEKVRKLHQNGF